MNQPTRIRHHCHWPGCNLVVPPVMWGCRDHWYALPKEIRDEIWRTYRPGQEADKRPGAPYIDAVKKARTWITEHGAKVDAELNVARARSEDLAAATHKNVQTNQRAEVSHVNQKPPVKTPDRRKFDEIDQLDLFTMDPVELTVQGAIGLIKSANGADQIKLF